jgi:hypothetical protein
MANDTPKIVNKTKPALFDERPKEAENTESEINVTRTLAVGQILGLV